MTDPTDPLTYIEIQRVDLTSSDWTEVNVSFYNYQGTGRYIAFKHPLESDYDIIRLDSITIDLLPNVDLSADTIVGESYPAIGSINNYAVSITNCGNETQNNYQIKLFRDDNIELGSVQGQPISHSQTLIVNIPWTPQQEGPGYLYAKVIINNDLNELNNQTSDFPVYVLSSGTAAFTVGTGDQLSRKPVDMYRKNSLFETIFFHNEINQIGSITGIQFRNSFQTDSLLVKPTKIWLGESESENLSDNWIPATQLNLVYDGLINYPPGTGYIDLILSVPYFYHGGNLIMMVNRVWDEQRYSSSDNFLCQTNGINRTRNIASDNIVFNAGNPPTPTIIQLSGQYPQTTLFINNHGMGILRGTVSDTLANPIQGAVVTDGNHTTYTNSMGVYNIELPEGSYSFSVTYLGFTPVTLTNIIITAGQITNYNVIMEQSTSVADDNDVVPGATKSLGNYPNPFTKETIITFLTKDKSNVTIEIFNIKGQLVKVLFNESVVKGCHRIKWDGKDQINKESCNGVYICRMKVGAKVYISKLIKLV